MADNGKFSGREVVIVEAVRTPVGRGHEEKGYYKDVHASNLLANTYSEVIDRAGIDPSIIEDAIAGCAQQFGEQGINIARNAWLEAGLPIETPATTIDRQCGSAQHAARATEEGRFDREIIPFTVNGDTYDKDQGIRPDTSLEKLAELKPAFKEDGKITAGNSSQVSDGAAAVLLMTREKAEALGLTPRARIFDIVTVGVDPVIMLTGPIPATEKLLDRNGMKIDDVDLIEINEAFASVVAAWRRELEPDMGRVNVNGGAIAIGHPLGSTGARLMTTLLHELERSDKETGLVTMCCGGGLGTGTLIQRV